jgi:Xaa-Pro aminopeptidase
MRYPLISPELFKRNREKLLGRLEKKSVAIIHSSDQMVRSGDQYYPYRQGSGLFYLTGIEQEMSVLVLDPDQEDENKNTLLFLRRPDPKLETWEGRKLDREEAGDISGIRTIHWLEDFEAITRGIILKGSHIYCNIPEHEKFTPEYPLRDERMMTELKKLYPLHEYRRLAPLMTELRTVKEPEEIDLIRKAIGITGSGLDRVLGFVRDGLHEYEVEAELTHEFIRQGAGGHAYPPIIASGGNACMLHYIKNDRLCRDGDLLLMDFGAEYANYAADCTRTVPVNGRFSKRQRELYDATLRVFRGARSLMVPGTTIEKINEEVGKMWEEEHIKLGLFTALQVKEQPADSPLYRKYYPHGTAHFLGLDVHDVGSKQMPLKPGMVLTCEPGIYIHEEATGIRIENNILVTRDGNIDLMEDFPIEAEAIEERMKRKNS